MSNKKRNYKFAGSTYSFIFLKWMFNKIMNKCVFISWFNYSTDITYKQ